MIKNKKTKYDNESLVNILEYIDNNEYVVPNFQREYVWKKDKIVSFLNSLLRHEPFGCIIIWESDEINIDTRNLIFEKFSTKNTNKGMKNIIDGQQRLTSLFSIFKWNLITTYEEDKKIKQVNEIEKVKRIISSIFLNVDTNEFTINQSKNKADNLLPLEDVICPLNNDDIQDFIKNIEKQYENNWYISNKWREIAKLINSINNDIKNTNLGIIKLENFDLDEVIDIFNNINTKGEKLSIFQILNAKWHRFGVNLEDEFSELKKNIFHLGFDKIDDQLLIDGLYLNFENYIVLLPSTNKINYSLSKSKEYYVGTLKKYIKYFENMCQYLSREGFNRKTLPSKLILKWLSYFYMKNNGKDPTGNQQKFLFKYIYLISINQIYKSSTNTQLISNINFVDYLLLKDYSSIKKMFDKFTIQEFNYQMMSNIEYGDHSMVSQLVNYILYKFCYDINKNSEMRTKKDFWNIDLHHIFPKNAKNDDNKKYSIIYKEINNYANLMPIDNDTNNKIKSKTPNRYYNELKLNNSEIDSNLEKSFIEISLFINNNFEDFLKDRSNKIINQINNFFNIKL